MKRAPKSARNRQEEDIDLKIFAQHKAIMNDNMEEFQDLEKFKDNQLRQHLFEQAATPKEEKAKKVGKKDTGLLLNSNIESDSNSSIDKSILEEYWEDFDDDNNVNEDKRKFKFMDLDKSFGDDVKLMEKATLEIFKDFDPENPPLLDYYDMLQKKYKLPSRKFLTYERDCYRKYIKMLKKVNKVLVKKAKQQARDTAKKTILNHTGSAREKFDKEIVHILLQYQEVKDENYTKTLKIKELEEKMKKYELTLAQTASYFRK